MANHTSSSGQDAQWVADRIRDLRSQTEAERLRELREILLPRIYRDGAKPALILQLLAARLRTKNLSGVLAMHNDPRLQTEAVDICFILQDHDPIILQLMEDSLEVTLQDLQRT